MEIEVIRIMRGNGVLFVDNCVYVKMNNKRLNWRGKEVCTYSAKVYRVNAGFIELATSESYSTGKTVRKRVVIGDTTGRCLPAERALAKLGYELEFTRVNANGESVYKILNL